MSHEVFAAVSQYLTGSDCSGGGGTVDAAKELGTTCVSCHGDRRDKVSCSNAKWLGHDGSKV
ncbi:hypothetical protein G3N55_12950, partial [Dissulfurirhabdus thermomarina]